MSPHPTINPGPRPPLILWGHQWQTFNNLIWADYLGFSRRPPFLHIGLPGLSCSRSGTARTASAVCSFHGVDRPLQALPGTDSPGGLRRSPWKYRLTLSSKWTLGRGKSRTENKCLFHKRSDKGQLIKTQRGGRALRGWKREGQEASLSCPNSSICKGSFVYVLSNPLALCFLHNAYQNLGIFQGRICISIMLLP